MPHPKDQKVVPWFEDHEQSIVSTESRIAPNLAASKHEIIRDMLIAENYLHYRYRGYWLWQAYYPKDRLPLLTMTTTFGTSMIAQF